MGFANRKSALRPRDLARRLNSLPLSDLSPVYTNSHEFDRISPLMRAVANRYGGNVLDVFQRCGIHSPERVASYVELIRCRAEGVQEMLWRAGVPPTFTDFLYRNIPAGLMKTEWPLI